MTVKERFHQSGKELKDLHSLVAIALLLALRIALGYVTTIQISDSIKIGYTIFPTTILCMMFGPVAGGLAGGIADLLGYFLKPSGPFFPGYTLDSMIAGMLYGISFYKREKITPIRVIVTLLSVTIIVNMCMTTTWISVQYAMKSVPDIISNPTEAFHDFSIKFLAIFPVRAIKNLIMLPINSIGVYVILQAVRKVIPKVIHHDIR